jgi:hypothetical protein
MTAAITSRSMVVFPVPGGPLTADRPAESLSVWLIWFTAVGRAQITNDKRMQLNVGSWHARISGEVLGENGARVAAPPEAREAVNKPLTGVSLVCLAASEPVACRSGS